jgi:5-methylcytosine-specific restriction enzyme A
MAPRRPCAKSNCPGYAVRGGYCEGHARPADGKGYRWDTDRRTDVAPRLRGRALQAARADLFVREPLCRVCAALGKVSPATIRDHIVPLAEGGQETEANVQPLCAACSDAKTHREAARGKR